MLAPDELQALRSKTATADVSDLSGPENVYERHFGNLTSVYLGLRARDGTPVLGIVSALTADGRRALANTRDADLLAALTTEAHEGRVARVTNNSTTNTIQVD